MDPTGDTTTSTEFTAWVDGMWHTSASVNPSKEDPYLGASEAAANQSKFGVGLQNTRSSDSNPFGTWSLACKSL